MLRVCLRCYAKLTGIRLVSSRDRCVLGSRETRGVIFLADDKLAEDTLPKQFRGDKFATTIREVVSAVRTHLGELPVESPTEAVLDLAVECFVDKLNLQLKTIWLTGFGSLAPGFHDDANTVRSANAFGHKVTYDTAKASSAAEIELRAIVQQIPKLRADREKEILRGLLDLLMEAQGQAQSIS
jgi:hypothetical protein